MCKNAILHGTYGYYRTGTGSTYKFDIVTKTITVAEVINIAAVGFIVFDGKGGVTDSQIVSKQGVLGNPPSKSGYSFTEPMPLDTTPPYTAATFPPPLVTSGSYDVKPNCTFTLSVDNGVIAWGVIVDDCKELYLLSMNTGNAVTMIARKM